MLMPVQQNSFIHLRVLLVLTGRGRLGGGPDPAPRDGPPPGPLGGWCGGTDFRKAKCLGGWGRGPDLPGCRLTTNRYVLLVPRNLAFLNTLRNLVSQIIINDDGEFRQPLRQLLKDKHPRLYVSTSRTLKRTLTAHVGQQTGCLSSLSSSSSSHRRSDGLRWGERRVYFGVTYCCPSTAPANNLRNSSSCA
jgi:hypothetical protein